VPRKITIAGVDRTADVLLSGFSITQNLTYQEDTCSLTIKSGTKPSTGDEIVILEGTTKLFGGIIDQVKDQTANSNVRYQCEARDYTFHMNKRLVVESYESGREALSRADEILVDIVTRYCTGFTTKNVQTTSPEVDAILFDYIAPSECFKQLCGYVGWQWYVDYERDIWFFNPADLNKPAPMVINGAASFRNFNHDLDMQNLRNRVYVRGGTYLSDFVTYEYKADGKQRAWILPYKPHKLTVSIGGSAPITLGIENVDDETTKTWMMNYEEKVARLASGEADIVAGTTVSFTFKFDLDVITLVDDTESQAAIAAIQGGDGIYEYSLVDDTLITIEAAEAAGQADLRDNANPIVKGSFDTEHVIKETTWADHKKITWADMRG
jgi:hypothetical protein